jgi:CheY-like chemotaxis protein
VERFGRIRAFEKIPMSTAHETIHFGVAVKKQRAALGISQEELADRAGLHRTYISDVERGTRNPSLQSIAKLAKALELTMATLFGPAGQELPEILLVEDDPNDVELTRRAFHQACIANPLQVIVDGRAALDYLFAGGSHAAQRGARLPGVVLLDLNLPKLGGIEVLRRLRADARTKTLPVIVLTASRHDEHMAECRQLGVEHYIVKPVDFQSFSRVTPHLHLDWALVPAGSGRSPS